MFGLSKRYEYWEGLQGRSRIDKTHCDISEEQLLKPWRNYQPVLSTSLVFVKAPGLFTFEETSVLISENGALLNVSGSFIRSHAATTADLETWMFMTMIPNISVPARDWLVVSEVWQIAPLVW